MDLVLESLLLGLSTGAYCLINCSPVVTPHIFSNSDTAVKSGRLVAGLLLGRLTGYLIIGLLSGIAGYYIVEGIDVEKRMIFSVIINIFTGLVLIISGVRRVKRLRQRCRKLSTIFKSVRSSFLLGLLAGVNLCPPFITAITRVIDRGGVLTGILFFAIFYISTSIYFIPYIGTTLLTKRIPEIRDIATISLFIIGSYILVVRGILGVFI